MTLQQQITRELKQLENRAQAQVLRRFFKTGPGQYGYGDRFRGITVPAVRKLVKKYAAAETAEAVQLLQSPFHEDRLFALLLLVAKFKKADAKEQKSIYRLYLNNTRRINNWDLVDVTAPHIVGAWLSGRDKAPLRSLARSKLLWERRIAIIATFYDIRQGLFDETLAIAAMLLADPHDLMHKAVGWMLREVGKRDFDAEDRFLQAHCRMMPRTMLRYAIERYPEQRRRAYLEGRIYT